MRASGQGGVITRREFFVTDADKAKHKLDLLEEGTSLELGVALKQATWFGESCYGIVNTRRGRAIRVKAEDHAKVAEQVRPGDANKFLGEKWEVSGLPVATSKDALVVFLDPCVVVPEHSFRQGSRRTWVVRARTPPAVTKV